MLILSYYVKNVIRIHFQSVIASEGTIVSFEGGKTNTSNLVTSVKMGDLDGTHDFHDEKWGTIKLASKVKRVNLGN
jgi:hypothetical protein